MSERRTSILAAMFIAIGPVAMSFYTPALPEIAEDLGTTDTLAKITLTVYFAGFAFAQLVAGPLSDALGRRKVAIAFLGVFLIGCLMVLMTDSIAVFIFARMFQGIGASVGIITSRAIVRDQFEGERSARIMNTISLIFVLVPATAPTLGALTLTLASWRMAFLIMAVYALILIMAVVFLQRETVVPDLARLRPRRLLRSYATLLASGCFLSAALVVSGAIGSVYAQATLLPFILMDSIGLTPVQFGLAMIFQSGSYYLGSVILRLLLGVTTAFSMARVGLIFIAAGSMGELLLLVWEPSMLRVMVPVAIYAIGAAFLMPAMTTAALAPFPQIAGSASALLGCLQMTVGLVGGSIGALLANPLLAMATVLPGMGAMACMAYLIFLNLSRSVR